MNNNVPRKYVDKHNALQRERNYMLDNPEEYAALKDKEYLGLLPLSKWSVDTVRGTILSDIINTIGLLNMRKALDESGLSVGEVAGKAQSLMYF